MTSENPPADAHSPALTPTLRWMADLMRLPELCARPKCRCAHACRGEPRDCLARYAPLVPEAARDGVQTMLDGLAYRLSFDELRDQAPEIDDLIEWTRLVEACAARAKGA